MVHLYLGVRRGKNLWDTVMIWIDELYDTLDKDTPVVIICGGSTTLMDLAKTNPNAYRIAINQHVIDLVDNLALLVAVDYVEETKEIFEISPALTVGIIPESDYLIDIFKYQNEYPDIPHSSTFYAVILAYKMGSRDISIVGMDCYHNYPYYIDKPELEPANKSLTPSAKAACKKAVLELQKVIPFKLITSF